MIIYLVIMLFWLVGIHGNNMLSAVKEALFTPLALENVEAFNKHETPKNIINMYALQMWGEFGGSGVTIGLVIAIMIFGKREDNKAIATLSLVPGLFNINETVTFGIPMVLNPILGIPFVFACLVTILVGYVLTVIGFCPVACLTVPWTTPPIVFGFLATGANIMGAVTQAILIVVSTVIYVPFLIAYEKYQNKQAAEA
jgi:cellobiose PTS system EIIC component